jgi:hypothetical protein
MPGPLKVVLTLVVGIGLPIVTMLFAGWSLGFGFRMNGFVVLGIVVGLWFGIEAACFQIYNLGTWKGWFGLVFDTTWSLPNTILGLLCHPFFLIWGTPTRESCRDQGWISFVPRAPIRFVQTFGPFNLGGEGASEKFRLLLIRLVGLVYMPIYLFDFALNVLVQLLWVTILKWLYIPLFGVKSKGLFLEPPSGYRVPGFLGWVLYATLFETWIEEKKGTPNP